MRNLTKTARKPKPNRWHKMGEPIRAVSLMMKHQGMWKPRRKDREGLTLEKLNKAMELFRDSHSSPRHITLPVSEGVITQLRWMNGGKHE
jgi:hypothetical protein